MTKEIQFSKAYILHRRPYRETSLLLDLWTKAYGRVSVVAKGVKRPRSKFQGLLEPFLTLQIGFTGRHDLKQLVHAELFHVNPPLVGDQCLMAFYLNELLCRLIAYECPMPILFDDYEQCLEALRNNENKLGQQWALRFFEQNLLTALGYAPDWQRDHQGQAIQTEKHYHYQSEVGFIVAEQSTAQTVSGGTLIALGKRQTLPQGAGAEGIEKAFLIEVKRLSQVILKHYLGDKPLQSRAYWQQVKWVVENE